MNANLIESPPIDARVAVVIPSYKVIRHIAEVVAAIPPLVWRIYVVDDACPEGSGEFIEANVSDERVKVVYHQQNQGVGGAVMTGYQIAIADGADIIVKIDGDGQMDASLIPLFVEPILSAKPITPREIVFLILRKSEQCHPSGFLAMQSCH